MSLYRETLAMLESIKNNNFSKIIRQSALTALFTISVTLIPGPAKASLTALPSDVLVVKIFSSSTLSNKDLANIALTSKGLLSIATDDRCWIERYNAQFKYDVEFYKEYSATVKDLVQKKATYIQNTEATETLFRKFPLYFKLMRQKASILNDLVRLQINAIVKPGHKLKVGLAEEFLGNDTRILSFWLECKTKVSNGEKTEEDARKLLQTLAKLGSQCAKEKISECLELKLFGFSKELK